MKNIKKFIFIFIVLFTVFFAFDYEFKANDTDNTSKTNELVSYEPVTDNPGNITCKDIFGDKSDKGSVIHILAEVYNIGRIVAVIMVIVLSMVDFTKAVASSDSGIIKKSFNKFIKRLVILVALFLIPGFVKIIFDITFGSGTMCSI